MPDTPTTTDQPQVQTADAWTVTVNLPGCLPEQDPYTTLDLDDARDYAANQLLDADDADDDAADAADADIEQAATCGPGGGSWPCRDGSGYAVSITPQRVRFVDATGHCGHVYVSGGGYLQAIPVNSDGSWDPDDRGDVSLSAFDTDDYADACALAFAQAACRVLSDDPDHPLAMVSH